MLNRETYPIKLATKVITPDQHEINVFVHVYEKDDAESILKTEDGTELGNIRCYVRDEDHHLYITRLNNFKRCECNLFLMSTPQNGLYINSKPDNLYLYKDKENKIFYQINGDTFFFEDKHIKDNLKNTLEFDQVEPNPNKYDDENICMLFLNITSQKGHTKPGYKHVGTALLEYAFKKSVISGMNGKIQLTASFNSSVFYFKYGFRFERGNQAYKERMAKKYEDLCLEKKYIAENLGSDDMYLPDDMIKQKIQQFGITQELLTKEPAPLETRKSIESKPLISTSSNGIFSQSQPTLSSIVLEQKMDNKSNP